MDGHQSLAYGPWFSYAPTNSPRLSLLAILYCTYYRTDSCAHYYTCAVPTIVLTDVRTTVLLLCLLLYLLLYLLCLLYLPYLLVYLLLCQLLCPLLSLLYLLYLPYLLLCLLLCACCCVPAAVPDVPASTLPTVLLYLLAVHTTVPCDCVYLPYCPSGPSGPSDPYCALLLCPLPLPSVADHRTHRT